MDKLHFREIDWVIYFPATGNAGRPLERYGVAYRDRIAGSGQLGRRINLGDVLDMDPVTRGFPHQVGHFRESVGRGPDWTPQYLRLKTVKDRTELEAFIWEVEHSPVPTSVVAPPPLAQKYQDPGSILLSAVERPAFARSKLAELRRRISGRGRTEYLVHCRMPAPEATDLVAGGVRPPAHEPEDVAEWEQALSAEEATSLLGLLTSASTAVYTREFELWLDVTCYELFFGNAVGGAHFRWSMSAPDAWKPVEEAAHRLLNLAGPDPSGSY